MYSDDDFTNISQNVDSCIKDLHETLGMLHDKRSALTNEIRQIDEQEGYLSKMLAKMERVFAVLQGNDLAPADQRAMQMPRATGRRVNGTMAPDENKGYNVYSPEDNR